MARATSRRKRPRNAAATRQAILQSARQAFARAGYSGAGVREIAHGAGVTAMLVNRYFGSKERLFAEAVAESMATTGVPAGAENAGADEHIAGLRRRLDEIDQKLIELWRERAEISHEVGVTRVAAGGTRLVLSRENEILTRFRDALGPDGAQLALLILRAGRGKLV